MKRALKAFVPVLVVLACSVPIPSGAGQIGFEEEFALAKDREAVLKQLITGTEEYYFYKCLHLQQTGQFDEVDNLLKLWIEKHNRTPRVIEIENRQALLKYDRDPQASLRYLQQKLGLTFAHQREVLGQKPTLATALDPNAISRDAFQKRALSIHPNSVNGFEDSGIDWYVRQNLSGDVLRSVLARLTRPDYPNLPAMIVDDLNFRYSGGFGSHRVHSMLLLTQLYEVLRLKPDILNNGNFVSVYLTKLQPSADSDWAHDAKEREAYYDRLWAFVSKLDPVHSSLKAGVIYNRLVHDRALGIYDKDRFMEYIKLPRDVSYINLDYLKAARQRGQVADLNAGFANVTRLIVIGQDEPLVRDYLAYFFITEDTTKPYEPYIDDTYLRHLLAETKLVNGLGDPEKWYSLLRDKPEMLQSLRERIDLDFAKTNKTSFAPEEPVALDLYVKNVGKLIVKVFEVNTLNYYREKLDEIGTDVNLDGLVANEEQVQAFTDPPLRRVKRPFPFPSLTKRGVYIVEFIGNGRSSRALIRKGQLRYVVRTSSAGQIFTILDESNRKVPGATLSLAGREYTPDKDGTIAVPFSNKPGEQKIILRSGDFATLASFQHQSESYALTAAMYVDREALIKRKKVSDKALLIVRPSLAVNGTPVSLSLLENPSLTITSVDSEGVSTTKEVADFKLFEDRESSYEFQVPENLVRLTFALKAKVQNLSQNQKQDLRVAQDYALNGIDATEKTEDLHLRHVDGKYFLDVLGKTGEELADRPVQFAFKHVDFKDTIDASYQTAGGGAIPLGDLPGIQSVRATGPQGVSHTWFMLKDLHSYPASVHAAEGDVISIAYMGSAKQAGADEISLLEVRGGTFVKDLFETVQVKDGFLVIRGLAPGDYDLVIKCAQARIAVRVTKGVKMDDYVLGENRQLQVRNASPLQIASIEADKENVKIRLANATKFARVHVIATRFMPEYSMAGELGEVGFPNPLWIALGKCDSLYVEGRDIGDEYRYILERKYAMKFPGNMLTRPGLLLNPWAIRKTETGTQRPGEGEAWEGKGGGGGESRAFGAQAGKMKSALRAAEAVTANLDFLAEPSTVIMNLSPDAQGIVTIPRKDLGAHSQLHVVACDPLNTAYRELAMSDIEADYCVDLRLASALDPAKHYTEQKQITVVKPGEKFTIADVRSPSKFEVYDTLPRAYALYATLSGDETLSEFSFILNWPKMTDAQKQEKYSKYACHELNVFLMKKDPAFFVKVVQPYLKNKKDKTFVDQYLIAADLSGFMKPWNHGQLNIAERALLAERVPGERPATARHVGDLYDLLPPDVDRFNHLFRTALKGSALETSGPGYVDAIEKLQVAADEKRRNGRGFVAGALTAAPATARALTQTAAMEQVDALKKDDKAERAAVRAPSADRAEAAKKDAGLFYDAVDGERRKAVRQLYRKLEQTEELAENNYYHLLIENQNAGLITVNAFWRDFAKNDGGEFLSRNLAEASRSFPEMMLALAETGLPFEAKEHKAEFKDVSLTLTASGPMIVYHKEIKEAEVVDGAILVGQNFFRDSDRYTFVSNERQDKYVTEEFLVGVVYGCQVVVTNTASSPQKLDVLLQIPRGSMPVKNGFQTRGVSLDLGPYSTKTVEYFFYFPAAGTYPHYPVHVAKNEKVIASAKAATLNVVEALTKLDTTSWDYVSQNGSPEQVAAFLKEQNVNRVALPKIAWRMRDADFFRQTLGILAARHLYDDTLWSYSIRHNELPALREYLQHADGFVDQCGAYLDSKPLTIDPVIRRDYQHLEYSPLVNARAHRLGKKNAIVNDRFFEQYERLMRVLAYRPQLDDVDWMALTYYLLLQDRVDEGRASFARVNRAKLATQIQHDYVSAYLDFYTDDHKLARGIATNYAAYPVDRWRKLFANVLAQLDEIEGKAVKVADKEDRAQIQGELAAAESNFDFKVEAKQILLDYQNVAEAKVNYYLMDIELLFSRSPFVQEYSGQFAYIKPNETAAVKLPAGLKRLTIPLPPKFHSSNVMVEIEAGGIKKSRAYFSNALTVQIVENYGQIRVTNEATGKPMPRVYVKVFARMKGGDPRFYKDGYTDLRGAFDYTSLSTDELDAVDRFSILLMSETSGSVVKEAAPPKR